MKTLGMRHIALNVKSAAKSKDFYCDFLGMTVEWAPDPQNLFLTSGGQDNLALHERKELDINPGNNHQALDHLGFIMASKDDVDSFYKRAKELNLSIAFDLKQHRDGAYSFYVHDPDGYVVQVIYHPPISDR